MSSVPTYLLYGLMPNVQYMRPQFSKVFLAGILQKYSKYAYVGPT